MHFLIMNSCERYNFKYFKLWTLSNVNRKLVNVVTIIQDLYKGCYSGNYSKYCTNYCFVLKLLIKKSLEFILGILKFILSKHVITIFQINFLKNVFCSNRNFKILIKTTTQVIYYRKNINVNNIIPSVISITHIRTLFWTISYYIKTCVPVPRTLIL